MAIIATNQQKATVRAMGEAMNASVNFSGALMEMLATVYAYILMAAIREAIQNAADAARRAGLSISEGVMVKLPTPSNPMITVIDKGSGMSHEFMETTYLSFGSSTKKGDNGAAGGLGVGRWAAYGYTRECYISTCHEGDMKERTYFQFQGPDATPQVQLASEIPGVTPGTKVYFPVKETDLQEALRAVAWIREVMQLTLGDTFSVDSEVSLPYMLPAQADVVLNLEEVDASLKGVKVYPMQGPALKYGRQGLQQGSLVVLTNQDAKVGGLPFHVQSPGDAQSVFAGGMVVEIPMSYNIPFMPSREEIKYTDEVNALLRQIDAAAAAAVARKAEELYVSPRMADKKALTTLLGGDGDFWHWFAIATRGTLPLTEALRKATGGVEWRGKVRIPAVLRAKDVTLKFTSKSDPVLREAFSYSSYLAVSGGKSAPIFIQFKPTKPLALVVNDVKTGGTTRFRSWLRTAPQGEYLYVFAKDAADAIETATAINEKFDGTLEVFKTSSMPEYARVVVGKKVVTRRKAGGSNITHYSLKESKQVTEAMMVSSPNPDEPLRVYMEKEGAKLMGLVEGQTLQTLMTNYSAKSLRTLLGYKDIPKLYLLTPKQVGELNELVTDLKEASVWDAEEDEFGDDDESLALKESLTAAKSWVSLEEFLANAVHSADIVDVLEGRTVTKVTENWPLIHLVEALGRKPRLELKGTKFDKAVAPYVDVLSGESKLRRMADVNGRFTAYCESLANLGSVLACTADDPKERQELVATLLRLETAGQVDYSESLSKLTSSFPLLGAFKQMSVLPEAQLDSAVQAIAAMYR